MHEPNCVVVQRLVARLTVVAPRLRFSGIFRWLLFIRAHLITLISSQSNYYVAAKAKSLVQQCNVVSRACAVRIAKCICLGRCILYIVVNLC